MNSIFLVKSFMKTRLTFNNFAFLIKDEIEKFVSFHLVMQNVILMTFAILFILN